LFLDASKNKFHTIDLWPIEQCSWATHKFPSIVDTLDEMLSRSMNYHLKLYRMFQSWWRIRTAIPNLHLLKKENWAIIKNCCWMRIQQPHCYWYPWLLCQFQDSQSKLRMPWSIFGFFTYYYHRYQRCS